MYKIYKNLPINYGLHYSHIIHVYYFHVPFQFIYTSILTRRALRRRRKLK
ncbi:hypothetical protein HanRHA438_Chr15g0703181 [Helianthus annuus]|nr:hypothetical protein HanIR_Chr15g0750601 [Helianthus annuus]KAJ0844500.1 hypothetical protein HanRHA438_Chr15g0703181 [Helianthus annuus]